MLGAKPRGVHTARLASCLTTMPLDTIMNSIHPLPSLLIASALTAGPALAGDFYDPPAPVAPTDPVNPLTWGLSANYASEYEFRGADFGDDLFDFGLEGTYSFNERISLTAGAWYANLSNSSFEELDLYAGLEYAIGRFTIGAGYPWYHYPSGGDDINEPYVSLGYDILDNLGFGLFAAYDDVTEGWYTEASLAYSHEINDTFSVDLEAGVSYGFDYYFDGDDINHAYAKAGLNVALNDHATLTPYVKGTLGGDDAGLPDLLIGGVSLSISF